MENRILFVDDDDLVLSCFERLFGRRFNLETALGPSDGMKAITTHGPYAVIVSDMRMPEMTRIEFLAKAKDISPETVGLVLTGDIGRVPVEDAAHAGCVFRFVEKPCPPDDLAGILEEALAQYRLNVQARVQ